MDLNLLSKIITSLCFIVALTGCKFFEVTHSDTPPLDGTNLAIPHTYKVPKKQKNHPASFKDAQLHQLIAVALCDAPDMHSAKTRVIRSRQLVSSADSTLWPSADIKGNVQKDHFSFQGTVPSPFNQLTLSNLDSADITLNVNYEIDFWGKNRETVASRLSEAYAAQMDLQETRLVLSASVAHQYFELQNTIIQHKLAKENVQLQQELSNIVVDRAAQGIESDIPVKTAIADTQSARLSVENYKYAEMRSRHQLAVLLGKNPFNTQIETAPFAYNQAIPKLPAVIPANLIAQRPDIASACAITKAAAHQINVAKTAFYPNVNLRGLLSADWLYFSKLFNVSFQTEGIKAAVDLPIFDAGLRRANLGVKYSDYALAVNQYNQTILTALRQVKDQMAALQTLNIQIKDQTQILNTTQANSELFQSRYKQGIIDYVQIIEMNQLLISQKATLFALKTRQKQAYIALLTALGSEIST